MKIDKLPERKNGKKAKKRYFNGAKAVFQWSKSGISMEQNRLKKKLNTVNTINTYAMPFALTATARIEKTAVMRCNK